MKNVRQCLKKDVHLYLNKGMMGANNHAKERWKDKARQALGVRDYVKECNDAVNKHDHVYILVNGLNNKWRRQIHKHVIILSLHFSAKNGYVNSISIFFKSFKINKKT